MRTSSSRAAVRARGFVAAGGGGPSPDPGFLLLTRADGTFLTRADGTYLQRAA